MCFAPAPLKCGRHGKAADSKRQVFSCFISGAGTLSVKVQGVNTLALLSQLNCAVVVEKLS